MMSKTLSKAWQLPSYTSSKPTAPRKELEGIALKRSPNNRYNNKRIEKWTSTTPFGKASRFR